MQVLLECFYICRDILALTLHMQFINARGVGAFVERCRELAARHGPRFEPAAWLVKLAAEGRPVADR